MGTFKKKPVEIEAIQFTGNNWGEIETFVPVGKYNDDGTFQIITLEGEHKCSIGDWVIKGVAGEFYPCKPEIFAATYEAITQENSPTIAKADQAHNDFYRMSQLIDNQINQEQYHHFPNTGTTVCCLTLCNGYSVVGESHCADLTIFDYELGRISAKAKAREKLMEIKSYLYKEQPKAYTTRK